MIIIKTRQPDPELEQKIRMLLEREPSRQSKYPLLHGRSWFFRGLHWTE